MDPFTLAIVVGAGTVILVTILWSWTTRATTLLETEAKKSVTAQSVGGNVDVAKIQLEGKKIEVQTNSKNVTLTNEIKLQKHMLNHDVNTKELLYKAKELEVRVEEQNIIQNSLNHRSQLKYQTKSKLGELTYDLGKQKLGNDLDMFDKALALKSRQHDSKNELMKEELGFKHAALRSNAETSKYTVDKTFEYNALSQRHEDDRLTKTLAIGLEMNRDKLNVKRQEINSKLEIAREKIESNRQIQKEKKELRLKEVEDKGRRRDGQSALLGNLLQTAVGVVCPQAEVVLRGLKAVSGTSAGLTPD